mmetsp:Transcript_45987/g.73972  ORF Transcript_45987/g.73972 Transcript_45987/m.73972 type:complete len:213 (+) Transcript_45987:25-663(+)
MAMLEHDIEFVAAMTFLPRQGASTRLAMGSQVIPNEFCNASDAAPRACFVSPPAMVVIAAAAIPDPAPHSAMHPPISAAKVACFAIITPTMPATRRARATSTSSFPSCSATARMVPGHAPQEPAVGAATMTPIELLTSMMAVTYKITLFSTSPGITWPWFMARARLELWQGKILSEYEVPASPSSTLPLIIEAVLSMASSTSSSLMLPRALS